MVFPCLVRYLRPYDNNIELFTEKDTRFEKNSHFLKIGDFSEISQILEEAPRVDGGFTSRAA